MKTDQRSAREAHHAAASELVQLYRGVGDHARSHRGRSPHSGPLSNASAEWAAPIVVPHRGPPTQSERERGSPLAGRARGVRVLLYLRRSPPPPQPPSAAAALRRSRPPPQPPSAAAALRRRLSSAPPPPPPILRRSRPPPPRRPHSLRRPAVVHPIRPPSRNAVGINTLGSPVDTNHSWCAARVTPMCSKCLAQC